MDKIQVEILDSYATPAYSNYTILENVVRTINPLVISTIAEETHKVMTNMKAVLNAAGMNFENVVKSSIFLSSMQNFQAVNEVYATYFNESEAPARETVEVSELPKKVNVEISMIAVKY